MKDLIILLICAISLLLLGAFTVYIDDKEDKQEIEKRIENIYGQGDMGYQMKSYLIHGEYRDEMGTEISERDFWESMYH